MSSTSLADGSPLDDHLCFALYSTMHAIGKIYAGLLPDLRLTYPQYLAMLLLWHRDDLGVTQIGDRMHLDSGTLTPLLKRLETAGLIKRTRAASDERKVQVRLTEAGRALEAEASRVPELLACAIGGPSDEFETLRHDLLGLRSRLLASRSDAGAASMCR